MALLGSMADDEEQGDDQEEEEEEEIKKYIWVCKCNNREKTRGQVRDPEKAMENPKKCFMCSQKMQLREVKKDPMRRK